MVVSVASVTAQGYGRQSADRHPCSLASPMTTLAFWKPYDVLSQFTDRSDPPRSTLADFIDLPGVWGASRLDRDGIDLDLLDRREIQTAGDDRRELPLEWRVALLDQDRRLRIRPLYDEQWMDTRIPYWEGVVLVEDEAGRPAGVGYMELTGYD